MSKKKFWVTAPDHDRGEWYEFETYDFDDAAEEYADSADSNSGGEFEDGTVVHVKDAEDGVPQEFVISVGYTKTFVAFAKR